MTVDFSDAERIAIAAQWADDAADWLAHQLNCGAVATDGMVDVNDGHQPRDQCHRHSQYKKETPWRRD